MNKLLLGVAYFRIKRETEMELIERNEQVIDMMDTCIQNLWESSGAGNKELISCIKKLNLVLKEFTDRVPEFQKLGVDVPEDIILTQMKNLMTGFEKRDTVLLADTMEYEIKNTLLFYNDILKELAKEQAEE